MSADTGAVTHTDKNGNSEALFMFLLLAVGRGKSAHVVPFGLCFCLLELAVLFCTAEFLDGLFDANSLSILRHEVLSSIMKSSGLTACFMANDDVGLSRCWGFMRCMDQWTVGHWVFQSI